MSDKVSTRRELLKGGAVAVIAAGAAGPALARQDAAPAAAADAAAPAVSTDTLHCAEALFDIRYTDAEREQVLAGLDDWIARTSQQRAVEKPNTLAPSCMFDPRLPGVAYRSQPNAVSLSGHGAGPLPGNDADIAFAPVWQQAGWIRSGALSARRLTEIYLDRIARYNGTLHCFVTVTPEIARAEADHVMAGAFQFRRLGGDGDGGGRFDAVQRVRQAEISSHDKSLRSSRETGPGRSVRRARNTRRGARRQAPLPRHFGRGHG